ncbi:type II secretion system F family protein [Candidatus Peribacteria bacterium]|nr:type II secretion system F family protein [Candidatus Peribacteria bacterium]
MPLAIAPPATPSRWDELRTAAVEVYTLLNDWLINSSRVKLIEKVNFYQMLGSLISAGVPPTEGVALLIRQTENKKLQRVLQDIYQLMQEGDSLATAMRQNDDVFAPATCSVVAAGEQSGRLDQVLKELADQSERLYRLQKKMGSIMLYPVILLGVVVLLVVIMMVVIVPRLLTLFDSAEALPWPTRFLISTSQFFQHSWGWLLLLVVALWVVWWRWRRTRIGSLLWDKLRLHLPLLGPLLRDMTLTRVSRLFSFLLASGIPIVEALRMVAHAAESEQYTQRLLIATRDITKGITLTENLTGQEHYFPQMFVHMVEVGEKTANIEGMMRRISVFYEERTERRIASIAKILEPAIMIVLACITLFMIAAVYLPILQLSDQVL